MKQIIFYKGIAKKVLISGPAIIKDQHYKCVVFKALDSLTSGVISCIAKATQGTGCPCATVEFTFPAEGSGVGTNQLIIGDNNLCVYDIIQEESESVSESNSESERAETERTIYRVYEAKVYAENSYPNVAGE